MSEQRHQPSRQRLTDQQRGKYAWTCIKEVTEQGTTAEDIRFKKRYRTLARQISSLIHTNGLVQTLAFLYVKADLHSSNRTPEKQATECILGHMTNVLWQFLAPGEPSANKTYQRLDVYLLDMPGSVHRRATVEALAFAHWLSRFAEAELPSEE